MLNINQQYFKTIGSVLLLLFIFKLGFCQDSTSVKQLHEFNFQFANQYRNNTLKPTWPIYTRNFENDPVNGALPRFETLFDSNVKMSRSSHGLEFNTLNTNTSTQVYKTFPKIQAPAVLAKLEVANYSTNHNVQIGFVNNESNLAILTRDTNNEKNEFKFELRQEGKETIIKTFKGIETNGKAYTLYFFLGNDDFRFMVKINEGLQHIGIHSEKRSNFTQPSKVKKFSPAFGVTLNGKNRVSISEFSAGYFESIGHADIRSVTYENGEPIRNQNGNFYISTPSCFMGKNGGSGGICVYEINSNGRIVRPVSIIVAQNKEWIESGTAAKLVFDRSTEQWLYVARTFPSPGGMLHIGKTRENLLNDGLHFVNCKKYDGIVENSLDGDLIKIKNTWYIAYHGGRPRQLHIAKSVDLKTWEKTSATDTGEGVSIAKMNNDYFIVDATSPTQMEVRKLLNPAEVIGSIKLNPSPGNFHKHGGALRVCHSR